MIQAATAAALTMLLPERDALAGPLSQDEVERLDLGEVIRRHLDLEISGDDYFGGISYAVVGAPVERAMAALLDPSCYLSILPMTLEARVIGRRGADMQLFLRQGKQIANAAYVLIVRRESPGLLRFWLDPTEPHDVADCFGYFRVQPWGKGSSLVTYAALLHLEFGVVKMLFSEKIRGYALETPGKLRYYLQSRGGA